MWGWILVPIAAALAYCYFGGYDLRIAIMGWYYDRYGWNALNRFFMEHLWPYNWSLGSTIAGPATLIAVLPAMFISPRRWAPWFWAAVVLWLLINPALWWWTCHNLPRGLKQYLGWSPRGTPEVLAVTLAQFAVFLALASAIAGRRRAVILLVAGLPVCLFQWGADWWANNGPNPMIARAIPYISYELTWLTIAVVWQATVFTTLIGSAIATRRRAIAEPWYCPTCNYDLRGLLTSSSAIPVTCPECGSASAEVISRT